MCPPACRAEVEEALAADGVAWSGGELDAAVNLVAPTEAKGLEFDAVVVVEPAELLEGAARGGNDLYVALTRSTQRLGVVHSGPLPAALAGLEGSGEPHDRGGRSPPQPPRPVDPEGSGRGGPGDPEGVPRSAEPQRGAPVDQRPAAAEAQGGGSSGR